MSIYSYIINWNEVQENVLDIEKFFLENKMPHTVINSGSDIVDRWMNVGDIRYYRQFHKAVNSFDNSYEYLLFIAGDVSTDSWKNIIDRFTFITNNYDFWAYAPYLTSEGWPESRSKILTIDKEKNVVLATNTDGIIFILHRDLVEKMKTFLDYLFSQNNTQKITSGWGLSMIWSAMSIYNNKMVIRDKKHILHHPTSRSYDSGTASSEMSLVLNIFYKFCSENNVDSKEMVQIIEKIKGLSFSSQNLF